jgi:hypothetical protein
MGICMDLSFMKRSSSVGNHREGVTIVEVEGGRHAFEVARVIYANVQVDSSLVEWWTKGKRARIER